VTQPRHHDQLAQFGDTQLTELSTRDICASTVHLILATAFFTGAAIGLAKSLKTPKKIYLASLQRFLETHFGLSGDNAQGMVESNARLYKRYILIEKIYNAGMQAARDWQPDTDGNTSALKTLLTKYQTLNMSGLNIEGIKETKPAPVEIETIAQVEPAPVALTSPPRWGGRLFWLIFVLLLGLLAYGLLFPTHIPAPLLDRLPPGLHSFLFSPTSPTP